MERAEREKKDASVAKECNGRRAFTNARAGIFFDKCQKKIYLLDCSVTDANIAISQLSFIFVLFT